MGVLGALAVAIEETPVLRVRVIYEKLCENMFTIPYSKASGSHMYGYCMSLSDPMMRT